jgi:HEAT repeat protein
MRRALGIFIVFLLCAPCFAGSTATDKARVRAVVTEVAAVSRRVQTLDELGRRTLEQSRRIIDIGGPAVYALSPQLDTPDWKVRFWIADILGYLDNPDAQRPLLRLLTDPGENRKVRRQAYRSLRRLKVAVPADIVPEF